MDDIDLQIDLDDSMNGLRPEFMSASLLAKIVAIVESAITEAADKPEKSELPAVALVGIGEGSVLNFLRVGPWARTAATLIITAIQTGDYTHVPHRSHKKLIEFSRLISTNDLSARIHGLDGLDAIVSSKHPVPDILQKIVKSKTRIYGEVESVGGERPTAAIRLFSTGKQLVIQVNESIAKELGKRLYDHVGIGGMAQIDLVSGDYISFKAEEILRYKGRNANPVSAIDRIEESFPDRWDGIDRVEMMKKLRDEGD